jgi:hypothetical protein
MTKVFNRIGWTIHGLHGRDHADSASIRRSDWSSLNLLYSAALMEANMKLSFTLVSEINA